MGLIEFILFCVLVGVVLTLAKPYVEPTIFNLIVIVVVILLIIALVRGLGVDLAFPEDPRMKAPFGSVKRLPWIPHPAPAKHRDAFGTKGNQPSGVPIVGGRDLPASVRRGAAAANRAQAAKRLAQRLGGAMVLARGRVGPSPAPLPDRCVCPAP